MSRESRNKSFIISGGGTGGHIFPAIAIANEIRSRMPDAEILFVGAKDRMEMERVPKEGYEIEGLWISGIQRSQLHKNFLFPFKLISSLQKCSRILRKFKPDAVIGTGGFASGPLLYMAQRNKIPTLVQEQNSYPGITNKLLASRADKICVAYDHLDTYFPKEKLVHTGNPIRRDIVEKFTSPPAKQSGKPLTLLVLGGSLGARSINNIMHTIYKDLNAAGYDIIWQCGSLYYEGFSKMINEEDHLKLMPFISDMAGAYQKADVIVSRAGAGTISELCLIGKPVVLIPSPNVAEDHQTKNAQAISDQNAAILVKESEINELKLKLFGLYKDKKKRDTLGENIRKLAKPDSTREIVDEVMKLVE